MNQMQLVSDIVKALEKQGVKSLEVRHWKVICDAATLQVITQPKGITSHGHAHY